MITENRFPIAAVGDKYEKCSSGSGGCKTTASIVALLSSIQRKKSDQENVIDTKVAITSVDITHPTEMDIRTKFPMRLLRSFSLE